MCGRVNVSDHPGIQSLLDILQIPLFPDRFVARYNIAPGARLFTAFNHEGTPEGVEMEWGIVPRWAKADQFSRPLTNARAESIWDKPSFKNLIQSNRAIIPINGFYEWKREGQRKTAYHIHGLENHALALGGIWQVSVDGLMQCCIVTTAANHSMAEVHDRMPVILQPDAMQDWLMSSDRHQLDTLMQPCSDQLITITEVSSHVNNARNDDAKCIEPVKTQGDLFG